MGLGLFGGSQPLFYLPDPKSESHCGHVQAEFWPVAFTVGTSNVKKYLPSLEMFSVDRLHGKPTSSLAFLISNHRKQWPDDPREGA